MATNAGVSAVPTEDGGDPGTGTGQQAESPMVMAPGRSRRATDRWMAALIRHACARPRSTEHPPVSPASAPTPVTPRISARLHQAVRWGFQEREFAEYEAGLARRATLGEFLAWARQRSGRTCEDVAREAGLSPQEVLELERGGRHATEIAPDRLARLTRALGTSIWTVLERLQGSTDGSASRRAVALDARVEATTANGVWSTEGLRRRVPFERVAMKYSVRPTQPANDVFAYRQALYRAWRDQSPD